MKLNGHALGLSIGLVWGGSIMLATLILIIKAWMNIDFDVNAGLGPTILKIGQFYKGYSVSFFGSMVGFIYGFVHAYVTARIIALVYNKYAKD